MASAQALEPTARPFYCHQCSHQWMKAQNSLFECPRCQEGFIEEVSDDFNPNVLFVPAAASPLDYFLQEAFSEQSDDEEQRSRNRARRNRAENNRQPSTSRSRSPHISNIVIGTGSGGRPGIVYQNRNNFASRFLSVAIDDIMSLIFTSQRQRAMTQEQLNAIPLATITSDQVEAQLQCAICFEDFQLNENEIRKLPCNHFFHEKCIFPWLRNNASCPICRTSLAANQPDSDEETASFIQAITNGQRARRANNVNNEAGPSTSSANNRSAPSQPSTSSRLTRSRIPIIRPRYLGSSSSIQANPEASTSRTHPRAMLMNPSRVSRQQALRQEEVSRIGSPISSRTRSQQRREGELTPMIRRRYRPNRGDPYVPASQRIASSQQSNIGNNNNNNNNDSNSNNNNNNNSDEVHILTRPIRRRRNAIYLSPTSRNRSLHDGLLQNFMNNLNRQRINIDSDTSSSDSDMMLVDTSSPVLLDSDE